MEDTVPWDELFSVNISAILIMPYWKNVSKNNQQFPQPCGKSFFKKKKKLLLELKIANNPFANPLDLEPGDNDAAMTNSRCQKTKDDTVHAQNVKPCDSQTLIQQVNT